MIHWPEDTAERIKFMREQRQPWSTIAMAFGVSETTLEKKVKELGLPGRLEPQRGRLIHRFTPEDIAYLRAEWAKHTPCQEIAAVLGRSPGVIRQRILQYEKDLPRRLHGATSLVRKFGAEAINAGVTPEEACANVKAALIAAKADAKQKAREANQAHVRRMLSVADLEISMGAARNEVIFKTRHAGVSLERLGEHFGVTRERIRQICDQVAFARGLELVAQQTEAAQ